MAYLILAVALAIAGYLVLTALPRTSPSILAQALRWAMVGVGGVSALFFLITGRAPLVILSLIIALIGILARAGGSPSIFTQRPRRGGGTSDVETEFLRMELDHESGDVTGEVLAGRFQGHRIEDMALAELFELLQECQAGDERSAQLLMSYLDRVHPDWREAAQDGAARPRGSRMTRQEALETLEIGANATSDEIRAAHRRLMAKHHPDRGGSTAYAARLNEAKEVLLDGQ